DGHLESAVVLENLTRDLAQHRADLALEIAHARFACVRVDQLFQRAALERDLRIFETLLRDLLRDEELPSDGELLEMRVAGERDDLHAILQWSRDRVRDV